MNSPIITPPLPARKSLKLMAESSGLNLRFINQQSIALYEVYTADGTFLHLSIAEQFDSPTRWQSRTEAEQDAMTTLALDEYYGQMTWDELHSQLLINN